MKVSKRWAPVLLAMAAGVPGAVQAASLDLNLNDEAVRGEFAGPLSNLFTTDTEGTFQAGLLYSDDKNIDLTQVHAGLLATGDTGTSEIQSTAGVGLRVQYTDSKFDDGGGLAIGGQFDLRFRGFERLGLQGYLWYSPKVLSFGDVEDQYEYSITADYEILRTAAVYVGYRSLRLDPDRGHAYDADDGAIVGLRFKF